MGLEGKRGEGGLRGGQLLTDVLFYFDATYIFTSGLHN